MGSRVVLRAGTDIALMLEYQAPDASVATDDDMNSFLRRLTAYCTPGMLRNSSGGARPSSGSVQAGLRAGTVTFTATLKVAVGADGSVKEGPVVLTPTTGPQIGDLKAFRHESTSAAACLALYMEPPSSASRAVSLHDSSALM